MTPVAIFTVLIAAVLGLSLALDTIFAFGDEFIPKDRRGDD
jgi:hypothetical protein